MIHNRRGSGSRRRRRLLAALIAVIVVIVSVALLIYYLSPGSNDGKATYNGDMLLRTFPSTQSDRSFLDGIGDSDIARYANMWGLPKNDNVPVYVYITSGGYEMVKEAFQKQNLTFEVLINDWQQLIDDEVSTMAKRRSQHGGKDGFDFENYHTFQEVAEFVRAESEMKPTQVNVTSLGKTFEDRDILLVKVGRKLGESSAKPVVYVNCAIHAREWISTSVCVWMIRQLTDAKNAELLERYDWWFVPVANPDGYDYSWTKDRMWRKSRSPGPSSCFGVDLNRNFEVGWNQTVRDSCSSSYGGSKPFSEIETSTIANLLASNQKQIKVALFLHSFSQLWLSPYGYNSDLPIDNKDLEKVMKAGVDALHSRYNTTFVYGSIANVLCKSSLSLKQLLMNKSL